MLDRSNGERPGWAPAQLWRRFKIQRLARRLGPEHRTEERRQIADQLLKFGEAGRAVVREAARRFHAPDLVDTLVAAGDTGILQYVFGDRSSFEDQELDRLKRLARFDTPQVTAAMVEALADRKFPAVRRAAADYLLARTYQPKTPREQMLFLRAQGRLEELPRFEFALLDGDDLACSEVSGESRLYFGWLIALDWDRADDQARRHATRLALTTGATFEEAARLLNLACAGGAPADIFGSWNWYDREWNRKVFRRLAPHLVRPALVDDKEEVRLLAAQVLAEHDDPQSIGPLLHALKDEALAHFAARGLVRRRWNPPDPRQRALILLFAVDVTDQTSFDALRAFAADGPTDLDTVLEWIRHADGFKNEAAVAALAAIWTPEAQGYMSEILHRRRDLRESVAKALLAVGAAPSFRLLLTGLRSSNDSSAYTFERGVMETLSKRAQQLSDDDLRAASFIPDEITWDEAQAFVTEWTTHDEWSSGVVVKSVDCTQCKALAKSELHRRGLI